MIDSKIYDSFLKDATEHDKARMNSLRVIGATAYLNIPFNPFYGMEYSNLEYLVIQSVFFGSKIIESDCICRRCKKQMDPYGWHALHCSAGPHMIHRHNALRNEISKYLKQAHITHKLEQKYKEYNAELGNVQVQDNTIPGDIKINSWYDIIADPAYMDITIGNIFCDSYYKSAAKQMYYVTNIKEQQKYRKYPNVSTLEPMVIDTMGAFGEVCKRNLQKIAHKIAMYKQKPYPIIINRIRMHLTAKLQLHNARMILASMQL